MKDELREAMERRRKPYPRAVVSGGVAYVSLWIHEDEWRDVNKLADAFCDEHPTDDDTPINDAWLLDVGFSPLVCGGIGFMHVNGQIEFHRDGRWVVNCIAYRPSHFTTRGQLRRLCSALGIELKEGKQ